MYSFTFCSHLRVNDLAFHENIKFNFFFIPFKEISLIERYDFFGVPLALAVYLAVPCGAGGPAGHCAHRQGHWHVVPTRRPADPRCQSCTEPSYRKGRDWRSPRFLVSFYENWISPVLCGRGRVFGESLWKTRVPCKDWIFPRKALFAAANISGPPHCP